MSKVPPVLPARTKPAQVFIPCDYEYKDIFNNDITFIEDDSIVIGVSDLPNINSDFIKFVYNNPLVKLKFKDYESVKFVDSILPDRIRNRSYIIDDGMRKDRSDMDLTKLKHINLIIPMTYLMWGIKFNTNVDVYCFVDKKEKSTALYSVNGDENVSYSDYILFDKRINELMKHNPKDSVEKVCLVSDYLQSTCQFIEGNASESIRGTFITPNFPSYNMYRNKSGKAETVLRDYNGICMGFSLASMILLNNGYMNEGVETVRNSDHAWNRVLIGDKYYYFDNTWNITRSDYGSDEALITLKFFDKYLLFGNKTALQIGHHDVSSSYVYGSGLSEEDYGKIDYKSQFTYMKKPLYKSYKK